MPRRYMAQLVFRSIDNLPENASVNTFHFRPANEPGSVAVEAEAIVGAIASAFGTPHDGNALSVARWISVLMSRDVKPLVKVYKSESYDPLVPTGPPVYEDVWAGMDAANNATAFPREVALCATYHANMIGLAEDVPGGVPGPPGNVHPRARVRGRIYFGPLTASVNDNATGRPLPTPINELCDAMEYLASAPALAAADLEWCVYSRVAQTMSLVTGGWVDNEFDTQRRRGRESTSRQVWGIGQ